MGRCCHCGMYVEDPADLCSACEILHLGYTNEIAREVVDKARVILTIHELRFTVSTVEEVHQLMVDLMYGSEDDENVMSCVGFLRKILTQARDAMFKELGLDDAEYTYEVTTCQ